MGVSRLQKLLDKKAQLDAQIRALEARTRTQERKNDTRRKVIWGALLMTDMERHPDSPSSQRFQKLADEYVMRAGDRVLLGLPPLTEAANDSKPRRSLKEEFSR